MTVQLNLRIHEDLSKKLDSLMELTKKKGPELKKSALAKWALHRGIDQLQAEMAGKDDTK